MPEASRYPVCRLEDIPDPGARGFSLPGAAFPDEWFLVRRGSMVRAYRNLCPHAGRFLNWKPDAFLTRDLTLIMCSGHGALFDLEDGHCVAGACLGRSLDNLPASVEAGMVIVDIPPDPIQSPGVIT